MSLAAFKRELVEFKGQFEDTVEDHVLKDVSKHPLVLKWLNSTKTTQFYEGFIKQLEAEPSAIYYALVRHFARNDLFFLLFYVLGRKEALNNWLIDRCWDVQKDPNEFLDLWAREHYKSTIITFALSIQDVMSSHGFNPDPKWHGREATIVIFSCTRPIAKAFLTQIKREFESNELLKTAFCDVLYDNPGKYAPKWSEDAGLVVKRKSNPKEATIEAWGVVEGQPTSKHFLVSVYDDLVTKDHIRSPYMIRKVIEAWGVSTNLGTEGGFTRYIGTRYHLNDPYAEMIKRKAVTVRKYGPTSDGSLTDKPVLKSKKELEKKLRNMGPYEYACQMMQDPTKDESAGFKLEWLKTAKVSDWSGMNRYILIDPANAKKEGSDYSSFTVYGLGADRNYYILDRVRDRLDLGERAEALFRLHKKYKPLRVGYERYGKDSDIYYIEEQMDKLNYHFEIFELGGRLTKLDRIRRLIPLYKNGRVYQPSECYYTDYQGVRQDLNQVFRDEEYYCFPVSVHDDMLDSDSRILDKVKSPDGRSIDFAEFPEDEDIDISMFMRKAEGIR